MKDFEYATEQGFTTDEIIEMERRILSILEYLVNPITSHYWANIYMQKWD